MTLKHTEFMRTLAKQMDNHLPAPYDHFKLWNTKWIFQLYYGDERHIHYEVSRVWNRDGRQLEIGLHFETKDQQRNQWLVTMMDKHLLEIQAALDSDVKAERWDRGWSKVYQIFPDQDLTQALVTDTCQRLAAFITVVQPIYEQIQKGD